MRGCAILDASGDVLAASGSEDGWAEAGGSLLAAADAAGEEAASHAHVATGDGRRSAFATMG